METWQFLLGLSVMLIFYGILVVFTGVTTSPTAVVMIVIFSGIGFYLGDRLTKRYA